MDQIWVSLLIKISLYVNYGVSKKNTPKYLFDLFFNFNNNSYWPKIFVIYTLKNIFDQNFNKIFADVRILDYDYDNILTMMPHGGFIPTFELLGEEIELYSKKPRKLTKIIFLK